MQNTRGTALLVCLFALLLLMVLGSQSLQSAVTEMKIGLYQQHETAALYLAEAGIHLMIHWFGHPQASPDSVQNFLKPRSPQAGGPPLFINEGEVIQFSGSRNAPDLQVGILPYQASLDSSWTMLWQGLGRPGVILSIKLYAPSVPGAMGTLESTARTEAGVQKIIVVQLIQQANPTRVIPLKGSWHEVY